MVSLYREVRLLDMSAMAYITRIKKTFLLDAMRSSQFIKRMKRLTKAMDKYLSEAKKKVLKLVVSKQWFDMIASGEKTEEYREIKGYWVRRLFDISNMNVDADTYAWALQENIIISRESFFEYQSKGFTHVLFINGYRKDSPRIEKEIENIFIGKPKKGLCPGKWLDHEFFIIKFK